MAITSFSEFSGLIAEFLTPIAGYSDSDPVGSSGAPWPDTGPNARDLTQSIVGQRPVYTTGVFGGRSAIVFDGLNDSVNNLTLAGDFSGIADFTALVVCRSDANDGQVFGLHEAAAGTDRIRFAFDASGDAFVQLSGGGLDGSKTESYTPNGSGSPDIFLMTWDGTAEELRLYHHGSELGTFVSARPGVADLDNTDLFTVGQDQDPGGESQFFEGPIWAIVLWDNFPSAGERTDIIDLAESLFITSNVPPDQPTIEADDATGGSVPVTGSAFSDPNEADSHGATTWRYALDSGMSSGLTTYRTTDPSELTAYTWTDLDGTTTYWFDVIYEDAEGAESDPSAAVSQLTGLVPARSTQTALVGGLDEESPARTTQAGMGMGLDEASPARTTAVAAGAGLAEDGTTRVTQTIASIAGNITIPCPPECVPVYYELTIFEDDDETPILGAVDYDGVVVEATVSTDPTHPRPYLMEEGLGEGPDARLDVLEARSEIGSLTANVLDKRTDPCDQGTGFWTGILADSSGVSQQIGHRVLVERVEGGTRFTILDGVLTGKPLRESKVGYKLSLKDIRERERRATAFYSNETVSLYPYGIRDGYGTITPALFFGETLIIPAIRMVEPAQIDTGTYNAFDATSGWIDWAFDVSLANYLLTEAGLPAARYDGTTGAFLGYFFENVTVRWRADPADPWTYLRGMPAINPDSTAGFAEHLIRFPTWGSGIGNLPSLIASSGFHIASPTDGSDLPTDSTSVEYQILFAGQPNEDIPFYLEGNPGVILRDLYDGVYSDVEPGIRYDTVAMQDFIDQTPDYGFRAILDEPVDDIKKWAQENIYQPFGWAPALTADGLIAPIKWADAPSGDPTLAFTETNTQASAGWDHDDGDAVTVVEFTYIREHVYEDAINNLAEAVVAAGSALIVGAPLVQVYEREITIRRNRLSASSLLGEKTLKYEPVTIRGVGFRTTDDEVTPLTGATQNDFGAQLANLRANEAFNRYLFGAPMVKLRARRSDTAVRDAIVGDYASMNLSWMPNYTSLERGGTRYVQVIGVRDVDYTWREFDVVDAGPLANPLAEPTFGPLSFSNGRVQVPITSIPAGANARLDYAVSVTEPAETSGLWTFGGSVNAPTTIGLVPLPAGSTVWVRARSEQANRRPSAWATAQSIVTDEQPQFTGLSVVIDDADGSVTVTWAPGQFTAGVRLNSDAHTPGTDPTFATEDDVDADDLTFAYTAGTVSAGDAFTVEAEAWSNYDIDEVGALGMVPLGMGTLGVEEFGVADEVWGTEGLHVTASDQRAA